MRQNKLFTTTTKYIFSPHTLLHSVHPPPPVKNPVAPRTQNEKAAPMHPCVVSVRVYTLGFILWPLQKCMVICSVFVRVKSCLGL